MTAPRIPSLLIAFKLMTTFTAIAGSLKFAQPVGHVGDEFHPFPLNQLFLNEDSGVVGGLLELSIVTLRYLLLFLTAFFFHCLYLILVLV